MPGQLIGREGCPWDNIDSELIIASLGGALLVKRTTREGVVVPDMFHIVPVQHITQESRLPDGCTSGKWMLMEKLYEQFPQYRGMPLTRYVSEGYDAGQRLEHWHEWVWFRTDDTELGPYGLFQELVGWREFRDEQMARYAGRK